MRRLYRIAYRVYRNMWFPFTPRQLRANPRREYELTLDYDGAIYGYTTAIWHRINDSTKIKERITMKNLREVYFNVLTMEGYIAHVNAKDTTLYRYEDNLKAVIDYYINRKYISRVYGVDVDAPLGITFYNRGRSARVELGAHGSWTNHVYLGTVELV